MSKKKDLVKVEDNTSLCRDKDTTAIINTDMDAYNAARYAKERRINTETRLTSLENKLDAILKLLEEK